MSSGVFPVPGSTVTVLVAEDDPGTRKFICAVLRTEGYTVLEAENGQTAMATIQEKGASVDLLIADYVMPGMDGRDLADAVRRLQPSTQVLFISGHIEEEYVQIGVMDAARRLDAHFLAKPFTDDELTRKVRSVMLSP